MRPCRQCRRRRAVSDLGYWLLILVLGLAVAWSGGWP
jgi:hypothetical protein